MAETVKAADASLAGMPTLAGTVASLASLLCRVTVSELVKLPVRVTVPAAAAAPAPSENVPGATDTDRIRATGFRKPSMNAVLAPPLGLPSEPALLTA